jgi:thioredoxin reductase/NAD-dependent dihydropyrimidine dehydrogenase PreA subunit
LSWTFVAGGILLLGLLLFAAIARRRELAVMERSVGVRERSSSLSEARLTAPVVDLSRCLGCATCVSACPVEGVLDLVHGQAAVVRPALCQGVAACARECPTGAIAIEADAPARGVGAPRLEHDLSATGAPGLFLAGEVTARGSIRRALGEGVRVGAAAAARATERPPRDRDTLDLLIVGAGPAGLACALEARRQGLAFLMIDRAYQPGGAISKYPRRKLVLTEGIELPLTGRLRRRAFEKEELVRLWGSLVSHHELPFRGGVTFTGLEALEDGGFLVQTDIGDVEAANVCLAIGRRGTTHRLGVPGEDLPKVSHGLLDAGLYTGRRVLVVGGGDSAVEAALALARPGGSRVTLSYRRPEFFRVNARSEERLRAAAEAGELGLLLDSEVLAISEGNVLLLARGPEGDREVRLPNDDVFVLAGGEGPTELLERSGVETIAPGEEQTPDDPLERGVGLRTALRWAIFTAGLALVWFGWHADYYLLPSDQRPYEAKHAVLRPGRGLGLAFGVAATLLVLANLAYLLRRAPWSRLRFGSLSTWMTIHVATGVGALLAATLHAAAVPGDTTAGHAWWVMLLVVLTGAVGRYLYSWVPRSANGRELELGEVKALLGGDEDEGFPARARAEVLAMVETVQWRSSFVARVSALLGAQGALRRAQRRVDELGREEGVGEEELYEARALARRAFRLALAAAHHEDVRAVLSSWRWVHRWASLLLVLLILLHVLSALLFGSLSLAGGR